MTFKLNDFIERLTCVRRLLAESATHQDETSLREVLSQLNDVTSPPAPHESHLGLEVEKSVLDERFRLEYHPQIELGNNRLMGFEALLRLDSELLRDVPPSIFVPLMEKSALICHVGEWVMDAVCQQRRQWHDSGVLHPECRVSVNLSARQFVEADLYGTLEKITRKHGVSPAMIAIEITESLLLENTHEIRTNIKRLREGGFAVSVDDFGTGYSSFAYLKQFKVDSLKIDQSFVRHIATQPNDRTIAAVVIKLAQRLGLKTVAEGVETHAQLSVLRKLKCDFAQGYLFSRPLVSEAVMDFVLQWRAGNRGSLNDYSREETV